jgi:hypothetical protein
VRAGSVVTGFKIARVALRIACGAGRGRVAVF